MPLSHAEVPGREDLPPLVMLHGLCGSRTNLQSVAKTLVRRGSGKVREACGALRKEVTGGQCPELR